MLCFTNPLFLSSFVSAILFPTCNLILITSNPVINPTSRWKLVKPAFRQETLTSASVVIINKDVYILILAFEIFDMKLWGFAYFPQEKRP